MATDDWEMIDGAPRWVWRLDEFLAREFPKRNGPGETYEVLRIAFAVGMERAAERGVAEHARENWVKLYLGDKLQYVRQRRNAISVVVN